VLRYLSPEAFSALALTLLEQTPQPPVPDEVLWFTLTASVFLEKCSPLATTFTAKDGQQLNDSPGTPRLQKSHSRPSPDWQAAFLGCCRNTPGFWLSPELFCSGGPSYNSDTPKKTGHLKIYNLTSDYSTISSSLKPTCQVHVSVYIYVSTRRYTHTHTHTHTFRKKKDNKVINTVIACAYLAQS